jgi:hypothetical protein
MFQRRKGSLRGHFPSTVAELVCEIFVLQFGRRL